MGRADCASHEAGSVTSVCVDGNFFQVGDDSRLTIVPDSMNLRDIIYFKSHGTHEFNKAAYPRSPFRGQEVSAA